jgi:hypothetical protein
MWLYATCMYSIPIFLYEYQPSRANAEEELEFYDKLFKLEKEYRKVRQ